MRYTWEFSVAKNDLGEVIGKNNHMLYNVIQCLSVYIKILPHHITVCVCNWLTEIKAPSIPRKLLSLFLLQHPKCSSCILYCFCGRWKTSKTSQSLLVAIC